MLPARLTVMTYNIWATARWPERADALRALLKTAVPDILCLQEVRPETLSVIDAALPDHRRVDDSFPGWTREGNIYWNRGCLSLADYGAEDVGMLEKDRRLFWVRLQVNGGPQTLFISTAHFTYQGHPKERETGLSPRVDQCRRTVEQLDRLVRPDEPALFMGDLNDPVHPRHILSEAGYQDCFSRLGLPIEPTHPARPTAGGVDQPLDWIVSNDRAQPVAACVYRFFHGDLAPSDHWPVLTVYQV